MLLWRTSGVSQRMTVPCIVHLVRVESLACSQGAVRCALLAGWRTDSGAYPVRAWVWNAAPSGCACCQYDAMSSPGAEEGAERPSGHPLQALWIQNVFCICGHVHSHIHGHSKLPRSECGSGQQPLGAEEELLKSHAICICFSPALFLHRYKQELATVQDELFQVVTREREAAKKHQNVALQQGEGGADQEKRKTAWLVSADLHFRAPAALGSRGAASPCLRGLLQAGSVDGGNGETVLRRGAREPGVKPDYRGPWTPGGVAHTVAHSHSETTVDSRQLLRQPDSLVERALVLRPAGVVSLCSHLDCVNYTDREFTPSLPPWAEKATSGLSLEEGLYNHHLPLRWCGWLVLLVETVSELYFGGFKRRKTEEANRSRRILFAQPRLPPAGTEGARQAEHPEPLEFGSQHLVATGPCWIPRQTWCGRCPVSRLPTSQCLLTAVLEPRALEPVVSSGGFPVERAEYSLTFNVLFHPLSLPPTFTILIFLNPLLHEGMIQLIIGKSS
ncbi:hypothetical protein MC885_015709 [Smutsia gigantea]|nr:hypothetical protein MC885_015709 [Smutsia gigantea]